MIMPCMNSTSACDRGGSVGLVDGGSVRLGLPGAPGCTTTGFAGSVCCAHLAGEKRPVKQKKTAEALAARNMPHSTPDPLPEWSLRLRRKQYRSQFDELPNIFSTRMLKGNSPRRR